MTFYVKSVNKDVKNAQKINVLYVNNKDII